MRFSEGPPGLGPRRVVSSKIFAPAFAQARIAAEKARLLSVMASLPPSAQGSLRKLTAWTARFAGGAIINPYAPNKDWADTAESVAALEDTGIIWSQGSGPESSSCLRNREVGEAAGEFVFGAAANPLQGNEILLPRVHESLLRPPKTEDGKASPGEGIDR